MLSFADTCVYVSVSSGHIRWANPIVFIHILIECVVEFLFIYFASRNCWLNHTKDEKNNKQQPNSPEAIFLFRVFPPKFLFQWEISKQVSIVLGRHGMRSKRPNIKMSWVLSTQSRDIDWFHLLHRFRFSYRSSETLIQNVPINQDASTDMLMCSNQYFVIIILQCLVDHQWQQQQKYP